METERGKQMRISYTWKILIKYFLILIIKLRIKFCSANIAKEKEKSIFYFCYGFILNKNEKYVFVIFKKVMLHSFTLSQL